MRSKASQVRPRRTRPPALLAFAAWAFAACAWAAARLPTASAASQTLTLDGSSSYVEARTTLLEGEVFSATVWVRPDAAASPGVLGAAVLSFAGPDVGEPAAIVGWDGEASRFFYTDGAMPSAYDGASYTANVSSSATFAGDAWHCLVVTCALPAGAQADGGNGVFTDATGASAAAAERRVRVYVDGASTAAIDVTTQGFPSLAPRTPTATKAKALARATVGAEPLASGSRRRHLAGRVDELRLYASRALTASEATSFPFAPTSSDVSLHLAFDSEDVAASETDATAAVSRTSADGRTHYAHVVPASPTAGAMPFDPIVVSGLSKTSPFSDALYTASEGPLGGVEVTINGNNFSAQGDGFLSVEVDGSPLAAWTRTSDAAIVATLPSRTLGGMPTDASGRYVSKDVAVAVSNGGSNAASVEFTYAYSLGEDWAADLEIHYNFDGDTANVVDRTQGLYDAAVGATYQGAPTSASDRHGRPARALAFSYGQRLDVPVALGSDDYTAMSLCVWLYAEPGEHTVYLERAGGSGSGTEANALKIAADGALSFHNASFPASTPAHAVSFSAWQFVCVTADAAEMVVYKSGAEVGRAATVASGLSGGGAVAQLGPHLNGTLDEVWMWSRALSAAEVAQVYAREEFAIELDGTSLLRLTNDGASGSAFNSSLWHSDSKFTIEMWVRPESVSGTQVLFDQPSAAGGTGDASKGVYVALYGGKVEFRVMINSGTGIFRSVGTAGAPITAGDWHLISATYDGSAMAIAVNGTQQLIGASSVLVDGSGDETLNVASPFVYEYTFLTIVSDPTSLDVQPAEATTARIKIGQGLQGLVGEVRLWGAAFDADDFTQRHACPPQGVAAEPTLYAQFPIDEGAGAVLYSGSNPDVVLRFVADPASVGQKPFWLLSDHARPDPASIGWPQSEVTGYGSYAATSGQQGAFTFQARDRCAFLLKSGGANVGVRLAGPLDKHRTVLDGSALDHGDGVYTGSYYIEQCGFYALIVSDASIPVADGTYLDGPYDAQLAKSVPLKLFVAAAETDASLSFTYDDADGDASDGRTAAVAGAPTSFLLRAVDRFGCPKRAGGDDFDVLLSGLHASEGSVVDGGDGTYVVTYAPHIPGRSLLEVSLDGVHVGTHKDPAILHNAAGHPIGSTGDGSPFCVEAAAGSSVSMDGAGLVRVPDAGALDLPDNFTIEAWVRPSVALQTAKLVSKESPVVGHGYWLGLRSGMLECGVYVGAGEYRTVETSFAPQVDTWTHAAASYDGVSLTLIADGEAIATESFNATRAPRGNRQPLLLGEGFAGLLDEVRMHSASIGASVMADQAYCPSEPEDATVLAHWRMNEKDGTAVSDHAGSNAGAIEGGASFGGEQAPTRVGVVSMADAHVAGDGLSSAVVNQAAPISLSLVDGCGFPYAPPNGASDVVATLQDVPVGDAIVGEAPMTWHADVVVSASGPPSPAKQCAGDSAFDLSYVSLGCGAVDLHVSVESTPIPGSPFAVTVASDQIPNAATSVAHVPDVVTAGVAFTVTIDLRDATGCGVGVGGHAPSLVAGLTRVSKPLSEGAGLHGQDVVATSAFGFVDNGDGTYAFMAVAPAPGNYVLDVGIKEGGGDLSSVQGKHLEGSPFAVSALPAPWREVATSAGDGEGEGEGGPGKRRGAAMVLHAGRMHVLGGWQENGEAAALDAAWRLDPPKASNAWLYRRAVTFAGGSGAAAVGAVRVVVDTASLIAAGKMAHDCSDVAFVLPSSASSSSSTSPVPFWIDPIPGCDAMDTAFWVDASLAEGGGGGGGGGSASRVDMLYGNAGADGAPYAQETPASMVLTWQDFEPHNDTLPTAASLGWGAAEEGCAMRASDASTFAVTTEVAMVGVASLKADARDTLGGALSLALPFPPVAAYTLRAFFFDANAPPEASSDPRAPAPSSLGSEQWISPNFAPCVGAANDKDAIAEGVAAVGTRDAASSARYAAAAPWRAPAAGPPRTDGWHALEIADDGDGAVRTFVDGVLIDAKPPGTSAPLDSLFLASREGVAAWDAIMVVARDARIVVSVGAEEAVVHAGAGPAVPLSSVATRGKAPPPRHAASSAVVGDTLHVWGGFVSSWGFSGAPQNTLTYGTEDPTSPEERVYHLDLDTLRWSSSVPYGRLRPHAREDHAMAAIPAGAGEEGEEGWIVAGGRHGATLFADLYRYDASLNAFQALWTPHTGGEEGEGEGPPGMFGHAAACFGDWVYLYGGMVAAPTDATSAPYVATSAMWAFDRKGTRGWVEVTPAEGLGGAAHGPGSRAHMATAVRGRAWYVFGGVDSDGAVLGGLYRYDFDLNAWSALAVDDGNEALVRAGAAMAFDGDALFLYGGQGKDAYDGTVRRITTVV